MTYIILAAGKGEKLYPLTQNYPKTSYKLDDNTTVLQRTVRSIRKQDKNAEIVIVLGCHAEKLKEELIDENVIFVINPFYEVTNSIASVWFARDYLERENVSILHGDVVFDDYLTSEYLTKETHWPYVLVDSSFVKSGAYNVVINENKVLIMSRKLENFNAKYCCMTKLDAVSARLVKQSVDQMINNNMYGLFFEDALVQMIMFQDFQLQCVDIKDFEWSEIDCVDDLIHAQNIQKNSKIVSRG